MTALELADTLLNKETRITSEHLCDAADMLRTQHALIEDLQKALREVPNTQLHYADHIRRQHEAIVKLREALMKVNSDVQEAEFAQSVPFSIAFDVSQSALKALKDTEGL